MRRITAPAENILLHALGLVPDDLVADDEAIHELKDLFNSLLRDHHVRVIAALFGKTMQLHDVNSGTVREIEAH